MSWDHQVQKLKRTQQNFTLLTNKSIKRIKKLQMEMAAKDYEAYKIFRVLTDVEKSIRKELKHYEKAMVAAECYLETPKSFTFFSLCHTRQAVFEKQNKHELKTSTRKNSLRKINLNLQAMQLKANRWLEEIEEMKLNLVEQDTEKNTICYKRF